MKDLNKYTPKDLHDYMFHCDICGAIWKYSQSTLLQTETGRGGCLVCPRCNDPIDYGLVPYTVPAEQSVRESRSNNLDDNSNITGTTPYTIPNRGPIE